MARSSPVLAAAPFKWSALLGTQPSVPHFLAEFAADAAPPASSTVTPAATMAGSAASSRFAGLSTEARRQQLMTEVSAVITNLLGTGKQLIATASTTTGCQSDAELATCHTKQCQAEYATHNTPSLPGNTEGTVCICTSPLLSPGVAADAPLMDSGLDSLGAVEFRSSLEARLSVQLPPTLVFDYPSLSAIVGYLDETLAAKQGAASSATSTGTTAAAAPVLPSTGPMLPLSTPQEAAAPVIAVLATHGRFPQPETAATQAPGVGGLVLRDGISVVPAERYDVELQLTEDMPARFGGFLAGAQVGMQQQFF